MASKLKLALKSLLGGRRYDYLRRFKRLVRNPVFHVKYAFTSIVRDKALSDIGRYYGTDKVDGSHSFNNVCYLDIYEKYFHPYREKNIALLEIGVRTGESLRTWKSYFKHGTIFAIDIDPQCQEQLEERIHIEIGDQSNQDFLNNCFEQEAEFDIIIDDGSHINPLTLASFDHLFNNRLKSGGIYIIEPDVLV